MKNIKILLLLILAINFNSIFSQESEDDETLLQLKKALAPHIKDKIKEVKKVSINQALPKDLYALQKKETSSYPSLNTCLFPYLHGVASGDPLDNRVIIWTRITPITSSITTMQVTYEVATDLNFTTIVSTGSIQTDSTKDFTVKVDIISLTPNTYYYYRFITAGYVSIVGRTKTLPVGNTTNIKLAFVNCNDYRTGYFNTFYKMAERNDLDAVVHLGDYIYEGGGGPTNRLHDPNAEIWKLVDYRTRLSQYRLDSNLRRCHQIYPWINIWDDHDIVVDALRDTSERHSGTYGSYQTRKYAAIKAFKEWLPIREIDSTDFYKNWRKFSFGNLLDLLMIDVRLYDRDRFATGTTDPIYNSPTAKMVGPVQLNWIKSELAASTKKWKIIGNGLMFGQLKIAGVPLVFENWDGYNNERNQLFNHITTNNIDNVIITSGDFHCSFANDIASDPYNIFNYNPFNGNGSLAVEFIPPSASSDNFDEGNDYGLGSGNAGVAETLIKTANPHIKFVELSGHGYILLDITPSRSQAEYWYINDVHNPNNYTETLKDVWYTNDGSQKLSHGTTASLPKTGVPLAPPSSCSYNVSGITYESKKEIILSVYPNPFNDFVFVNFLHNVKSTLFVELLDVQGKQVYSNTLNNLTAGNYQLYIPSDKLAKGLYTLKFANDKEVYIKKLVKE